MRNPKKGDKIIIIDKRLNKPLYASILEVREWKGLAPKYEFYQIKTDLGFDIKFCYDKETKKFIWY